MPEAFKEKLGLHRPELRAWAFYDWANSAMVTTIITAVFPVYFIQSACADMPLTEATKLYAYLSALSLLAAALISPLLGAMADFSGAKKKFLAAFLGIGCLSTMGMFWIKAGSRELACVLFFTANLGLTAGFVFYDSLLPHIAKGKELDRVSSAGYALGYLGGGIHLALALLLLHFLPRWSADLSSENLPVRLVFVSVGLWWLLFSIPLFLKVPEPARHYEQDESPIQSGWAVAWTRLGETFRSLRSYRQAFLMLLAFLLYNDGIGTIIRMAASYGTELGLTRESLLGAILLVQFIGIPMTFLFGILASKLGQKATILIGLLIFAAVTVFAYYMNSERDFWILAIAVGCVQGGCQAISRSLFASMVPKHKSAEFFGFFGVMDKFAGILGPLSFALVLEFTGSSRGAILSIIAFFALGAATLCLVDPEKGKQQAKKADEP